MGKTQAQMIRWRKQEVAARTHQLYQDVEGGYIPSSVVQELEKAKRQYPKGDSMIFDKNATPAEEAKDPSLELAALRPLNIAAERCTSAAEDVEAQQLEALAKHRHQQLHVHTGSAMLDQWKPWYLCTAHPFTLVLPVGGYDIPRASGGRRPTQACKVSLADLVRSLPRQLVGQFRRHWSFVPALWKLYFRQKVQWSATARAKAAVNPEEPQEDVEEDAASAMAVAYKELGTGTYPTQSGKRRKIGGDVVKLLYMEHKSAKLKEVVRNFLYASAKIPGTQEHRAVINMIH